MKKTFFLTTLICVIFTACLPTDENIQQQSYNFSMTIASLDEWSNPSGSNKNFTSEQCISLRSPKPIEEIIDNSYIIVKGRIDRAEKVDTEYIDLGFGCLYNYDFVITDFLKGTIAEKEICFNMYSCFGIFEEGKEYVLFVYKYVHIHIGDSYHVDSLIFSVDGENIIYQCQHGRAYSEKLFLTVDDFKLFLDKNTRNTRDNGGVDGVKYIDTDDIKDIVNFSEVIIKIKVTESELINPKKGLCFVKYDYVDTYKGELGRNSQFTFFEDQVQIGKEAIVLLSKEIYENGEGYSTAISSRNSVIYEDDERYDKYLAYIGLDSLQRKEDIKALGLPVYFTAYEKDIEHDTSLVNPDKDCFVDIVGIWEIEWESKEKSVLKTYVNRKKKLTFMQNGKGIFEEGSDNEEFSWKYVLQGEECIGVEYCGDNVKKQRLMLENEDGKGFIFSHVDIGGVRGRTNFNDIKIFKLNKTSPHIRITNDKWIHIPRGNITSSEIDGLCADAVPFYVEGDDVYLKYYDDVNMEIEIVGEGGGNMWYRVYDDNYWPVSNNLEKLTMHYSKGKYIIGIHTGWSDDDSSVGYEFLIGLDIK